MLTIAYITNRRNPRFHWFCDSLVREVGSDLDVCDVLVVDYWKNNRPLETDKFNFKHVAPKPTVWQGPYRLTSIEYFAASNTRNTAICHAKGDHIVFVDDLSVIMPGWYGAVKEAIAGGYIGLGAYKKVRNLVVEDGVPTFEECEKGVDHRLKHSKDGQPIPAKGEWLYGCSFVAPVEALLQVNGFDEDADSMGGEDYLLGLMLQFHGWKMVYDPRMFTIESDEAHGEERPFMRLIKPHTARSKFREKDASHAILHMVTQRGRHKAPNYFGHGGIRALRERILAGEDFPVFQIPEHHWCDGQPLREM